MNGRRLRVGLLALVALAQLGTPLSMIARRERVLQHGEVFRFRAAPVDPADAFRGRFVALDFEEETAPAGPGRVLERGRKVYARLAVDGEGFARIREVGAERPGEGPYLAARVQWTDAEGVHLRLPFDRYYLEEELAPLAERAYRDLTRGEERRVWAQVRIDDRGFAVLEDLYLAGVPVERYLEERGAGAARKRPEPPGE